MKIPSFLVEFTCQTANFAIVFSDTKNDKGEGEGEGETIGALVSGTNILRFAQIIRPPNKPEVATPTWQETPNPFILSEGAGAAVPASGLTAAKRLCL